MLMIACGAIAKELVALKELNGWHNLQIECLPADLHNAPAQIVRAVRERLTQVRDRYDLVFVAYADCGTAGALDQVLAEFKVERLPGAHCYEFFASKSEFDALCQEELGSYFLTDFLVRHFDRLVWRGLGLDRHPELLTSYFGNYRRLVYLAQSVNPTLLGMAQQHARQLGLEFHLRYTGLTPLCNAMPQPVILHAT